MVSEVRNGLEGTVDLLGDDALEEVLGVEDMVLFQKPVSEDERLYLRDEIFEVHRVRNEDLEYLEVCQ